MVNIILLPGFDGTGVLYAPLQAALGDAYSTTVITYRDEVTFNDYVESVASNLTSDQIVLIAESFSGPIALELIKRYPSKIKCAVLCATFAMSPFRYLAGLSRFVPTLLFRLNIAQEIILRYFCFDRKSAPSLIEKSLSVIQSVPADVIKNRIMVLAGINMYPSLSQMVIPVLYLQAINDRIVSEDLSNRLVSGLSNVTVQKIEGPHLLFQSRPDECVVHIRSFIAEALS